jgi:nitrate reductase molybdenum cofactor assembly chaperone NarJ/NarW
MEQMLLAIASRLISYPEDNFYEELETIEEWLNEEAEDYLKADWLQTVKGLKVIPLQELRETYVATFDLKEQTGLYLTAHEMGDSRNRGAAMIKLQKTINEAGFERADEELADYIPMIYEFLAVAEDDGSRISRLKHRAAVATYQIAHAMDPENPYTPVFNLLMEHVFDAPTVEEIEKLKREREKADTDELPYPLMYE